MRGFLKERPIRFNIQTVILFDKAVRSRMILLKRKGRIEKNALYTYCVHYTISIISHLCVLCWDAYLSAICNKELTHF